MARKLRYLYDDSLSRLEACLKAASKAAADNEPSPDEWSAKQTFAHLFQTERFWIANLDDSFCGFERIADGWGGNFPSHINATVIAYGSVRGMLNELRRLSVKMVAFFSALPDSFIERKASYFQTATQMLELESHTISHFDQINAALAAAKKQLERG